MAVSAFFGFVVEELEVRRRGWLVRSGASYPRSFAGAVFWPRVDVRGRPLPRRGSGRSGAAGEARWTRTRLRRGFAGTMLARPVILAASVRFLLSSVFSCRWRPRSRLWLSSLRVDNEVKELKLWAGGSTCARLLIAHLASGLVFYAAHGVCGAIARGSLRRHSSLDWGGTVHDLSERFFAVVSPGRSERRMTLSRLPFPPWEDWLPL